MLNERVATIRKDFFETDSRKAILDDIKGNGTMDLSPFYITE
jgi:hypothetical protein